MVLIWSPLFTSGWSFPPKKKRSASGSPEGDDDLPGGDESFDESQVSLVTSELSIPCETAYLLTVI